jgi:beta-lactamase regulating signal transducer with metallopeptidase domain
MSILLELTLRGSVAAIAVVILDRSLSGWISGWSRRLWWCLVPFAFLVPLNMPTIPDLGSLPRPVSATNRVLQEIPRALAVAERQEAENGSIAFEIWLAGALAYGALVGIQTARASRRWSRDRLSTDHPLLDLLENCKMETGVTAPIGLVVSDSVQSPAILGWLRPRILLPASLVASAPPAELRPILLHELAHFRWYDIPFNWLLTLARAVHWFNPFAHLSAGAWAHFREEAADEAAVKWMHDDSGRAYGDALVRSLRQCRAGTLPFGALGIVESLGHLRRRVRMINRFKNKAPRFVIVCALSLLSAGLVCSISASAADAASTDPKSAVTAGMQAWLTEIDEGHYELSWKDSSAYFRERVTLTEWIGDLTDARGALGKCVERTQVSLYFQKDGPKVVGPKHEWAIAQYDASYKGLKYAFETVTFVKEADGNWRASGYFTHPR